MARWQTSGNRSPPHRARDAHESLPLSRGIRTASPHAAFLRPSFSQETQRPNAATLGPLPIPAAQASLPAFLPNPNAMPQMNARVMRPDLKGFSLNTSMVGNVVVISGYL
jgi:hypothetical protein